MKRSFRLCILFMLCVSLPACAQLDGSQPAVMSTENVNADLVSARAASQEKRYADAEVLMLRVIRFHPNMVLPWVELGVAELGLKKFSDAEKGFKIALGIEDASSWHATPSSFYIPPDTPRIYAPGATRTTRNLVGGKVNDGDSRSPEVLGVCYSSLGEISIRTGRPEEAQAYFDAAAAAFPKNASHYRFNETVFFFQTSRYADAQLKAAEEAIALDPGRAMLYYFKGQALASKSPTDPQTHKMVLLTGCAEAYQKYLQMEPNGQFADDVKTVLAAAGLLVTSKK